MNRVALITGGTAGVGAATAVMRAQAGYRVGATYTGDGERAEAFSRTCGIPVFRWNVADAEACIAGVAEVERVLGSVDILVNISSINGQSGQFGQTNYSAVKAGILSFTKTLAQEGARDCITVNVITPGYINTDMVKDVPDDIMEKIVARIPVGRLGRSEEIARCVLFLVAEKASFITGSSLSTNGGMRME